MEDEVWKKLWELGYTDTKIAEECQVNLSTIRSWRKKHGLENNLTKKRKENNQLRLDLLNKGYSDTEIADLVGISSFSVFQWRSRRGLYKDQFDFEEELNSLSAVEKNIFEHLKKEFPDRKERHLLSLAKYSIPRIDMSPSGAQRKFVRKLKVSGFKTVYYFEDNVYDFSKEAVRLFVQANSISSSDLNKVRRFVSTDILKYFYLYLK